MNQIKSLLTVHVKPQKAITLEQNQGDTVIMIPFTGFVTGPLFEGNIEEGGVDTQIISEGGKKHTLSARYIINGVDHSGQAGKLYIENNGQIHEPNHQYIFRTYPKIITDCNEIKWIEKAILVAEGKAVENGVEITIFQID